MRTRVMVILGLGALAVASGARGADRMRFWNLTSATITQLYLAPAGTTNWGPNQCANDKDGSVDPDERLALVGVKAGRYDVRLTDVHGRTCMARNVAVEEGKPYAFALSESDLTGCSKQGAN